MANIDMGEINVTPDEPVEEINYYEGYCNYSNVDFLSSLGLNNVECEVLEALAMRAKNNAQNKVLIPKLRIEDFVRVSNSPYKVLRTLNKLREDRFIFYEIALEVPDTDKKNTAHLIDKAFEKAVGEEDIELKDPPIHLKKGADFDRYAVLNLEYPVVYYCYQEEQEIQKEWDIELLADTYRSIQTNSLANVLSARVPAALEFLNYIQSMFNQPLTALNDKLIVDPEEWIEEHADEVDETYSGDNLTRIR